MWELSPRMSTGIRAGHIHKCISCRTLPRSTSTSKVKAPALTILGKTTPWPLLGGHPAVSLGKPLRAPQLALELASQPPPETGALVPPDPAHRPELSQLSDTWEERPPHSGVAAGSALPPWGTTPRPPHVHGYQHPLPGGGVDEPGQPAHVPFSTGPDDHRIPNRQTVMGVPAPLVETGWDASGRGGGAARGQGLPARKQEGTGVVRRSGKTGMGAESRAASGMSPKRKKRGPQGAATTPAGRQLLKTQTADVAGALHLQGPPFLPLLGHCL